MKIPACPRPLVRFLLAPLGLLTLLATTARATWSIVVPASYTGEVCVATATCINNLQIARYVPVIVVGQGAAAAQSSVDATGVNRLLIRDSFRAEDSPAQILADLAATDSMHQNRQYGIVSLYAGDPVSFTGSGAGAAALGVVGQVGTIRYAIQGNVLTGDPVILETEQTFLDTEGDLATRIMAAMETARSFGGDGRCSCDPFHPTICGSPPPSFTHSAYTACIFLARVGDTDGPCTATGCGKGTYYLKEKLKGGPSDPDPVITLTRMVEVWRKSLRGVPDHILTEVDPQATRLPADGQTSTEVQLRLVDLDGVPLTQGGQTVAITDVSTVGGHATVGNLVDNGDGTFGFTITAATTPGMARFQIVITQGAETVQLFPDLEIGVDPAAEFHVGHAEVSASVGAEVPLTVDLGAISAAQPYLLLLGASGTQPGTPYGGLTIPLNSDRFLRWSLLAPDTPIWPGNHGNLDTQGRGSSVLTFPPGHLVPFVGRRFNFCALLPAYVTAPDGFDVQP